MKPAMGTKASVHEGVTSGFGVCEFQPQRQPNQYRATAWKPVPEFVEWLVEWRPFRIELLRC